MHRREVEEGLYPDKFFRKDVGLSFQCCRHCYCWLENGLVGQTKRDSWLLAGWLSGLVGWCVR